MTSEYWDQIVHDVEQHNLKGWLDWQFIEEEYIRPQVSGDPKIYYLQHFISTHLPNTPVKRALSLGCGGGNLERALISLNAAHIIDAYDVSTESIRLATALAEDEGIGDRINYEARDINTIKLPPNTYDFVIIKMALHHFEQLEHVYQQVAASLKPNGVFVFNEFVGPSRYQWTDLQLQIMNSILKSLPQKNTWSAWTHNYLQEIARPTVEEMIAMDPSEAVRSGEIMTLLTDYFEILEYKPYGGTILHILLNHIMPTFDLNDPADVERLRGLFQLEKSMIQNGVIGSDFAYVVARPLNRVEEEAKSAGVQNPASASDLLMLEAIQAKVNRFAHWYHRIEVYPGVVTPGSGDTEKHRERFDQIGLPLDASGLRVLDIGTADGYFAFLMEQRGATEVVAIDYRASEASGFAIASELLSSRVKYFVENIYNLTPEKYGMFDVVLCFGVLYHLRNPMLALDKIRAITKTGGTLFIETQLLDNAVWMPDGTFKALDRISPELRHLPLWQFYGRDALHKDATNKWTPNLIGLKFAVEEAQFAVHDECIYGARGGLRAEAVVDQKLEFFRLLDSGTRGF
jgi:2-polyprenyl-3-methyl-5-hydroxy-6-metoxy-1,4-benzoquinol methylase